MTKIRTALAGCLLFVCVPSARAGIITQGALWDTASGGNGHFYEIVMPTNGADSFTWTAAESAAASLTYKGTAGHLVTVGSAAESDFLHREFGSYLYDNDPISQTGRTYAWIGLYAPTLTSGFQWVTGEPVTYTDWGNGEPNFYGTGDWQYVHYWTRNYGSGATWTWNNEQNNGYLVPDNSYGYIAEFDGNFTVTPEPSTLGMMLVGLGTFGWRRLRRGIEAKPCPSPMV